MEKERYKLDNKDTCEIYCYNEEKVNRIQDKLGKEDVFSVTQLFKALADENRAKISYALCQGNELCVCDSVYMICTCVATAYYYIRTLYTQDIVKYRKEGKLVFYSLDDEHIKQLFSTTFAHKKEVKASVC